MMHPSPELRWRAPAFLRPQDLVHLPVHVSNPAASPVRVEVVMRGRGYLESASRLLDSGEDAALNFVLLGWASEGGRWRGELDLRVSGVPTSRVSLEVPDLADSVHTAPLPNTFRYNWAPELGSECDESVSIERCILSSPGEPFPESSSALEIPYGSNVTVRVAIAARPPDADLCVYSPVPAGLEDVEVVELAADGGPTSLSASPSGFRVEAARSSELAFVYRGTAAHSGTFVLPPADVHALRGKSASGRTAWEAVRISLQETSPDRIRNSAPDDRVSWGSGSRSGHVEYRPLRLEGKVRGGAVLQDGTVWEGTAGRTIRMKGGGWIHVSGHSVQLGVPLARKVRARLRELGCPAPQVQER